MAGKKSTKKKTSRRATSPARKPPVRKKPPARSASGRSAAVSTTGPAPARAGALALDGPMPNPYPDRRSLGRPALTAEDRKLARRRVTTRWENLAADIETIERVEGDEPGWLFRFR